MEIGGLTFDPPAAALLDLMQPVVQALAGEVESSNDEMLVAIDSNGVFRKMPSGMQQQRVVVACLTAF